MEFSSKYVLLERTFWNALGQGHWATLWVKVTELLWPNHGLQTPREEIVLTAWPKNQSHSQIFRYGQSRFCLPLRPKFSDIFDLCLHWLSIVRVLSYWWKNYLKKNPLQDLLSSLNAVISANERNEFITDHMTYNLAYTWILQMTTA